MKKMRKRNKTKVSSYEHAAMVRKEVKLEKAKHDKRFNIGDFVNQKYYPNTVGMIVETVKAKKKYGNNFTFKNYHPVYVAYHLYNYTISVMWMNHPSYAGGIADMDVRDIKIRPDKKVV